MQQPQSDAAAAVARSSGSAMKNPPFKTAGRKVF
jgi:hypothetical protein